MKITSRIENKKISVIVPVYHTEPLLAGCIESICKQSWRNIEVIIVDDGSRNGADQIVDAISDDRVRIITHEKNRGLLQARITGMQYASGDYIAFVDSDDLVSIDFFRLLVSKAEKENADVVIGSTVFVEESFLFAQGGLL